MIGWLASFFFSFVLLSFTVGIPLALFRIGSAMDRIHFALRDIHIATRERNNMVRNWMESRR